MTQITHEGADDSGLRDLVGQPKSEMEAESFEAEERRIRAVELAIASFSFVPDSDLLRHAASIENFILNGYKAPETPSDAPQTTGGAKAFVETDDGGYKEV